MYLDILFVWSEMILNYQVIVESYTLMNGVVGNLNPIVKSPFHLAAKPSLVGNKPHPAPRGFLSKIRPMDSNSCRITRRWLFIYYLYTTMF